MLTLTQIRKIKGIVLVDFYANWCGPCNLLKPKLKDLEKDFPDRIFYLDIDTPEGSKAAKLFDIKAIPYTMVFKNGKPKKAIIGVQNSNTYRQAFDL